MSIFEFLAVGAIGFWLLIAIELIVLFYSVSRDSAIAASISLLLFGLAMQFISKVDIAGYVITNPLILLSALCTYLALGVCWGIFKWRDYLVKYKDEYDDIRAKWLTKNEDNAIAWEGYLSRNHSRKYPERGHKFDKSPQIGENKQRWINWAALWPISVVCYLIADLVFDIFNSMYRQVADYLQGMSDRIYSPIATDLRENRKNDT